MTNQTIGILGGMGPRATIEFESRLLSAIEGGDQSMPRLISANDGSIPDRSDFLLNIGPDPLSVLIEKAILLKRANVDIVCMPCNTAHSPKILSRLMARVPLPIIDMPAACMLQAEEMGFKSVLILGTSGTKKEGLFDSRSVNIDCIYPEDNDQLIILDVIQKIKNNHKVTNQDIKSINNICKQKNPDGIIIACTELSMIANDILADYWIIDSIDILVESCIKILNI